MTTLLHQRRHKVKTWPQFFQDQWDGIVTFQTRYNMDRNFQKGDLFVQCEYDPNTFSFTGRELDCEIVYVTSGYGLSPGFVALQLKEISRSEGVPAKSGAVSA